MIARERTIVVTVGVALALSVAFYIFGYRVCESRGEMLAAQLVTLNQEVYGVTANFQSLEALISADQSRDSVTAIDNARRLGIADVVSMAQGLRLEAENRGLKVFEVTPVVRELVALENGNTTAAAPPTLAMGIRLSGGLPDIGDFCGWLETQPYFADAMNIHIASRESGLAPAIFVINFRYLLGVGELL